MKIYKLDSKKKLRVLDVFTEGGTLIQKSGLIDGGMVEHRKDVKAKNVGRANETTVEQQAILQADAVIVKKLREGYFKTIEEANSCEVILPMLAKDYFKEQNKVIFPCYGQPKLDGMRGIGKENILNSRTNKPIETVQHIVNELAGVTEYLDGELYAHGKSFQDNMKLLKKYREGETENVKYHVYDMILPNTSFIQRYNLLKDIVKEKENIEIVDTVVINNQTELSAYHTICVEEGYEGCMIRWGDDGYKINGRSSSLLKYKMFHDVALTIEDITPNDADPTHGTVWVRYKGTLTKTGARLSHEERVDLLVNKNKYIGQTAEIRYFEETDDGSLRFPVFVGFRLDK